MLIDLRHTSDGDPALGAEAARLFVKAGTLAIREARGQGQQKTEAKPGDGSLTLPVTLLTTNGTSQAAEVFAAALLDNDRAKTVGERTLGRAAAQKLVKLPDGSGLWLTYARWLSPKGTAIHGTGLVPAVPVAEPDRRVRRAAADRGPDPRQGPRDRRRARRPPRRPRSLASFGGSAVRCLFAHGSCERL